MTEVEKSATETGGPDASGSGARPAPVLAELTTLRVGGPAEVVVAPETEGDLVAAALAAWATGDDWLLVGGGSNTVASDAGVEGTLIRIVTRGIERDAEAEAEARAAGRDGRVRLRVQAGEPWDELVEFTVAHGWAGIEALSGIPGNAGASPVQNIGAYGQEVSSSLVAVTFLDYETGEVERLEAADLALGYRTSVFKQGKLGVVLAIELELHDASAAAPESGGEPLSQPIGYGQLAQALGVELGARVSIRRLRDAVLALRASKGMVLDAADHDTASAGSFFTNPIVREAFARSLPSDAPRWPVEVVEESSRATPLELVEAGYPLDLPAQVEGASGERLVKLSAAWLIEHAGVRKGFALPGSRASISTKHTLALTNRGGATAAEIVELARFVQARVQSEFGVILQPEPVLVGLSL